MFSNKVNVNDLLRKSQHIRNKIPLVLAKIENDVNEINKIAKSELTIADFIEIIPQNNLLKIILVYAQNDEGIVQKYLEHKNNFIKEKQTK